MKFNDQKLIDKVLATDSAKQFLDRCLKRITSIANPNKDSDYAVLPFILSNFNKFGIKNNDKFFNKIKHIIENFDKIKTKFVPDSVVNEDDGSQESSEKEETLIKKIKSLISDTLKNAAAD
jgi:translation initiation factor 2 alpha subunit (eIF-2alpha)